jgi:simple sugar transport system ATP-binding protein
VIGRASDSMAAMAARSTGSPRPARDAGAGPGAPAPLVEMQGICKHFPGVQALDHVDFALAAGEIHGLLGENGAGKTTLMNVLGGRLRPDAGSLRVDGAPVRLDAPRDALRLGIGMVHQHPLAAERHSVLDNLVLGWPDLGLVPRRRAVRQAVREAVAGYGLDLAGVLDAPMHRLPVGTRQKVEIARALLHGARVLVLDEPTAVLTPDESAGLFALMRAYCAQGHGVVLISHKLDEVLALAHRITVLRRGRRVASHVAGETDLASLAQDMIGRALAETEPRIDPALTEQPLRAPASRDAAGPAQAAPRDAVRLERVDVAGDGPAGATGASDATGLHAIDLALAPGQILGIAGVAGSGQRALAELLTGLRPPAAGTFTLFGEVRAGRDCHPRAFARDGVAHIPEDRQQSGVAGALGVAENLLLRRYREFTRWRGLRLDRARARAFAARLITEHDIRCAGPDARAASLSGGNLQKLIVARELDTAPRLVVAAYPFRGLDVGAIQSVRAHLRAARDRGAAVVLFSEELALLFELADLLGVLFRGRLFGPAPPSRLTVAIVGQWMGGHPAEVPPEAQADLSPEAQADLSPEAQADLSPEVSSEPGPAPASGPGPGPHGARP